MLRIIAVVLLASALSVASLPAQQAEPPKTMRAVRMGDQDRIDLDGVLEETVWSSAEPATGFRQEDPDEGAEATEPTEVYVVYDAHTLYIGVKLYDSNPDGILSYQRQRDEILFSDDRFQLILDTFRDGRTGYFFETNPAGMMGDGLIGGGGGGGFGGFGGGGVNRSWDGIWEARVHRDDEGWSAEIAIPFSTLNFNPDEDTWGINFQRTVRRKSEDSRWNGYRRNQSLYRPVHAGRLTGLQGMSQGTGLEVTPYAVAGWSHTPDAIDETEFPRDAGFDLTYNVTPSLRAAITLNTDFAEVEVDQRRVNLTRFPLFFPERRDFFLEGSGVFAFAERNGVNPYFSRNIGLNDGAPVPIQFGARLGGQAGRFELGFLQIRTAGDDRIDDEGLPYRLPSEDFTVARVKRSLFEQSSIGLIYTRRAARADPEVEASPDQHTLGWDLDLFTSRFLGDKNFQFEAFFVWNSDPVAGGSSGFWDRSARGIRVNYPNDIWRIHTSYREFGDEFDPSVGFTRRNGFRRVQPTVVFAPRPTDNPLIRQLEFEAQFEYLMDIDWELETRKTDFKLLGLRFHSGDRVDFDVTQLFERLDEDFTLGDVTIPAGEYDTWSWRASIRTASRRRVSGSLELSRGGFWSGTRNRYELGATVRPAAGISVGTRYEFNDVELDEGSFDAQLVRVEAQWQASPWTAFTTNVQYDDQSEIIGWFGRFRWIIHPGNDLYFVYTYNWENTGADLLALDYRILSRGVTTKINYTYRF